ncbi:bifunctional 3-(3-hydroxy-phenyl)propionate/3-hydroxycinnamic acid hydroxylase [Streptomyces sp. DSM 44917]|uniref:Bifunctional 3-(3-hydroxy-phenyl)propionate/3-hydroxycinnamic acid hydroxylase n=1 Tax=Streptomyces boetiae TaxID=3075541 RepID=A0ABU2L7J6_9ACTN|nr:bifunctional 3-(3-hydroxy-phenyl)propionate/3-hydroxycinnamic acid hydroxylase [Streptomyces sp. DSM 44917]MDT0307548.1 bifunctional 3-(3-hydroxy-phenyl)propionate/3-hydroxycinnamic acid hydroxylase [Streptomyces sp. DSM 44917]
MTDVVPDFDVVQVGFGPVGQVSAALLGQRGHSVGVFERWPSVYPLPRAGHVDHEIMRIFQGLGAAEEFERRAIPVPSYDWFNGEGKLLLHMDWDAPTPSGWKSDYLMYQPHMEDALMAAVARQPGVAVHHGWQAVAVVQREDHVAVTLREGRKQGAEWVATGRERTVTARYVIGADGAGSFTRSAVGIGWEDFGFAEDWLVLDVRPHDPDLAIDMPEAGQICDPARPVSPFRWLGREHARWEFMLLPGERAEEMTTPAKAWELLARWGVTPQNADVIRSTVYTFRSLLAPSFREGRVLLIGDAAHLMPPFLGQGMCSGVRDAANLAWKLDLVLRGRAPDTLLDTYTEERRPHVEKIIRTAIELGKVVCITDPQAAAARDEAFLSGQVPPPPPFPWLESGVLQGGRSTGAVGRLGVQGRVARGGRTGRADDVLGGGWSLLSRRAGALAALDQERRGFLAALGVRATHLSPAPLETGESAVDLDLTYSGWFEAIGAEVVLVRPDFTVFGTAVALDGLPALVDELRARISGMPA